MQLDKHRKDIDGLRAVAILPVLFFHAHLPGFDNGFLGVDIFFVISGFLITGLLYREITETGRVDFVRFYERRVRRIAPALYLTLLVTLVCGWFWLLPSEYEGMAKSMLATLGFVSNIFFWQQNSYFAQASELQPLLHTWSLSVEEQFYLFFPLVLVILIRLFDRKKIILALGVLVLLSCLLAQALGSVKPEATFFLLPTRVFELTIGGLAAVLVCTERFQRLVATMRGGAVNLISLVAGFAVIGPMIFPSMYTVNVPGMASLIPCIGAAALCAFGIRASWVSRTLSWSPFVWVGLISFSLYLVHQPLFAFARIVPVQKMGEITFVGLLFLSFCLAYCSYRFVEQPVRNSKLAKGRVLWILFSLASLLLVVPGVVIAVDKGVMQRYSVSNQAILAMRQEAIDNAEKCSPRVGRFDPERACKIGMHSATNPSVALFGDSHAAALASALSEQLREKGLAGVQYTYLGCAPLLGVERLEPGKQCADFARDSVNAILGNPDISTVVVSARWQTITESSVLLDNGEGGGEMPLPYHYKNIQTNSRPIDMIGPTLDRLVASGKKVILIYPIPELGWDVAAQMIRHAESKQNFSVSHIEYQKRAENSIKALDSVAVQVFRVDPSKFLCDSWVSQRCAAKNMADQPLYYDSNHLSPVGAKVVVEKVGEFL